MAHIDIRAGHRSGAAAPALDRLPPCTLAEGSLRLQFARTAADVDAVKRLRFDVFNCELNEGLTESFSTGRDEDEFDAGCHHLMVLDDHSGRAGQSARQVEADVEDLRAIDEAPVDDAVAIFERANPPQMPSTPTSGMTGQAWGFVTNNDEADKDIAALIACKGDLGSDAIVDRMANRALQEFRSGR